MFDENWEARCRKARTDKQKLGVVVDFMVEGHVDVMGGYPHKYEWIGDKLAIASLCEDSEVSLDVYTKRELLKMFDAAEKISKANADWLFDECFRGYRV